MVEKEELEAAKMALETQAMADDAQRDLGTFFLNKYFENFIINGKYTPRRRSHAGLIGSRSESKIFE